MTPTLAIIVGIYDLPHHEDKCDPRFTFLVLGTQHTTEGRMVGRPEIFQFPQLLPQASGCDSAINRVSATGRCYLKDGSPGTNLELIIIGL